MRRFIVAALVLAAAGFVISRAANSGIVPPDAPIPALGEPGAPHRVLTAEEQERWIRGRALFDKDFGVGAGVGPVMNGDSCRGCHLDPVIGGGGGIDVQVQRPMLADGSSPPETGGLAQTKSVPGVPREEIPANVLLVEERNSPTILGLGLVETISDQTILAGQDPDDDDDDGIRGVAHMIAPGVIGRLGWKANVPSLRAFVRDAMGNEMGITVPPNPTNAFGILMDGDAVQDPEINGGDIDDIVFFLELLDFAPKLPATAQTQRGEALFTTVGCAKCHTPAMDGVELFSDLLLHDVLPSSFEGVTQGEAGPGLYRTPPLRGLRDTAPYFHDGRSETIEDAVRRHEGEAEEVRQAFEALTPQERADLLAFLASL